ncbi:uncharacterized protein LOC119681423 [Teleopsis dalmanni]|uniref:uncharacterized protein LOC119681423 n=1 Tax=Teleopsis dalmanni TaxID=139649 RepID=UPI0018CD13A5|nr:uncharacterized protein LOC119681423 [Teleopsis dalmanni]
MPPKTFRRRNTDGRNLFKELQTTRTHLEIAKEKIKVLEVEVAELNKNNEELKLELAETHKLLKEKTEELRDIEKAKVLDIQSKANSLILNDQHNTKSTGMIRPTKFYNISQTCNREPSVASNILDDQLKEKPTGLLSRTKTYNILKTHNNEFFVAPNTLDDQFIEITTSSTSVAKSFSQKSNSNVSVALGILDDQHEETTTSSYSVKKRVKSVASIGNIHNGFKTDNETGANIACVEVVNNSLNMEDINNYLQFHMFGRIIDRAYVSTAIDLLKEYLLKNNAISNEQRITCIQASLKQHLTNICPTCVLAADEMKMCQKAITNYNNSLSLRKLGGTGTKKIERIIFYGLVPVFILIALKSCCRAFHVKI